MGWATIKNGALLALAEKEFDVFLTVDRNLSFQQHLPRFAIAVVVFRAISNRLSDLQPLVPKLLELISDIEPGKVTYIEK